MKNISQEIFENVLTEINTIEDQISTLQIEINTIRRKTSRLQDLISNFLKSPQYVKKTPLLFVLLMDIFLPVYQSICQF